MKSPVHDEDDQGEVFLDESDIIHEVTIDDEGPFLSVSLLTYLLYLHIVLIIILRWIQIFLI